MPCSVRTPCKKVSGIMDSVSARTFMIAREKTNLLKLNKLLFWNGRSKLILPSGKFKSGFGSGKSRDSRSHNVTWILSTLHPAKHLWCGPILKHSISHCIWGFQQLQAKTHSMQFYWEGFLFPSSSMKSHGFMSLAWLGSHSHLWNL